MDRKIGNLQIMSELEKGGFSGLDTEHVDIQHSKLEGINNERTGQRDASNESTTLNIDATANIAETRSEEERRKNTVQISTYFRYFNAGACIPILFVMSIAFLATQGLFECADIHLLIWASEEEDKFAALMTHNKSLIEAFVNTSEVTIPDVNTYFHKTLLVTTAIATILFGLIRALLLVNVTLDASQNLHNSMVDSLLASGIDFFQKDSITGQIQNRFSRDVRQLDTTLPKTLYVFLQGIFKLKMRDFLKFLRICTSALEDQNLFFFIQNLKYNFTIKTLHGIKKLHK
ncbi:ATP-binding cassette sub-family C member 4-like [Ruditapes philippinarum]|uniref:ATP-binding cassette sub-family C member 4-like n=1 Tax=Ruditapes philippinarum TaxID=129788 RepID=UPI00295B34E9|nr:ATP-binding cassette sub-family C member 4-like [Ruditapes philippinarum]